LKQCKERNFDMNLHFEYLDLQEIFWVDGGWGPLHDLARCGSEQRQVVGSCKHGNKPLGYIKCREFLEELRNY
jgi:hypothetical protein